MRTGQRMGAAALLAIALSSPGFSAAQTRELPQILDMRARVATVNEITRLRLDRLLPRVMAEAGVDLWLIVCHEDHLDPVFRTMVPADAWCPITQILAIFRTASGIERLNLSRTDMRGLHADAWDWRAWDAEKKEGQWDSLARVVRERNPRRIAVNKSESGEIWAADGLTASLQTKILDTLGPDFAGRIESGERLTVQWLETLLDEEIVLYERVTAVAHALIAELFSNRGITPGVTTLDDLLYAYVQRVADLGLELFAWPWLRIRGRSPEAVARFGADDTVVRPGDLVQIDAGIRYLRYYTDHCEWAYVLHPGETDAPAGVRAVMAAGNRLQDIFLASFEAGLTGNALLGRILRRAGEGGIPGPKIYSHAIGYFLHEPGPLIGLPWEQKDTGPRGEVRLVPDSTFTAELSVAAPVAEWGGRELRLALEQMVVFTSRGARFLDGRQTAFHLVR